MGGEKFLACLVLQRAASQQSLGARAGGLRRRPLLLRKRGLINFHGRAGANQVLVSIYVIDAGNGWPELVLWLHKGLQKTKDATLWKVLVVFGREQMAMRFPSHSSGDNI